MSKVVNAPKAGPPARPLARLPFAAGLFLAIAVPPLLLCGLSRWQLEHAQAEAREALARTALARADTLVDDAAELMRDLDTRVDPGCTPRTQAALRAAVNGSLHFREAGVIADGTLQCLIGGIGGRVPAEVDPALRRATGSDAASTLPLVLTSPVRLPGMPEPLTLVLRQRAGGNAGFWFVAVDPRQFTDLPHLDSSGGALPYWLRVDAPGGAPLATFAPAGFAVQNVDSLTVRSARYGLRATVAQPRSDFERLWQQRLPWSLGAGAVLSLLLAWAVWRLARRGPVLERELRRALIRNEFRILYQPLLDVASQRCIGAEALIRWQHPRDGLVPPEVFLPMAEETGLMIPLTIWLMQRIREEVADIFRRNPDFHLSMNLSPHHFLDRGLVDAIRQHFSGDGLRTSQIVFEITEQELLGGERGEVLEVIQAIRTTGARLALDDFGTGYSSLRYLTEFPFDYLKIDKMFVDAIGSDSVTAGLIDVIADLGRRMQLTLVAEGVETEAQFEYVRRLGIDLVQGYFFSKPLRADLLAAYIESKKREAAGRTATPLRPVPTRAP